MKPGELTAETVLYVWAGIGDPGAPPDRIQVETCLDCAALVPVARFDVHGEWHRRVGA